MSRSLIHLESLKYIGLVEDVLLPFLPTYLVEMVVLFLVLRRHDSARRVSEPRERLPVHNLWILPLQVWSLQAALLSHRNILISWIGVGLTDITPHEEPLIGLFRSLLALLVVITCQLTGVLITRSSANTLGLDNRTFTAFSFGLIAVLLDVFFHHVVIRILVPLS